MKIYVNFNEDILVAVSSKPAIFDVMREVDYDGTSIDLSKIEGYKIIIDDTQTTKLVFDETKYNNFINNKNKQESLKQAEALKAELAEELLLKQANDNQAYVMRYLYPEWDSNGVDYVKDQRLMYQNKFYKVLQNHKSQVSWTPDKAVSLFVEISDPAEAWPAFKKPTGAHDAYAKGSKVTFEGKHYISKIDANVYSPTEYPQGWELVA